MRHKISIRPLGRLARLADVLMRPVMALSMELNGTPDEPPQETHFWNNEKLTYDEIDGLDETMMCFVPGSPGAAASRWWGFIPRFHLPIVGWQEYVVLRPKYLLGGSWYVGWITRDAAGVSLIPVRSMVKCLVGAGDAGFFALDASGRQIPIEQIGSARLGYGPADFKNAPLR